MQWKRGFHVCFFFSHAKHQSKIIYLFSPHSVQSLEYGSIVDIPCHTHSIAKLLAFDSIQMQWITRRNKTYGNCVRFLMLSRSTPNWNWGKVATNENPSVKFVSCRRRFINTNRSSQRSSIVCVVNTHTHTHEREPEPCVFQQEWMCIESKLLHCARMWFRRALESKRWCFCALAFYVVLFVQFAYIHERSAMCVKWKNTTLNGCDVESNQVHCVSHTQTHTPNVRFWVANVLGWTICGDVMSRPMQAYDVMFTW